MMTTLFLKSVSCFAFLISSLFVTSYAATSDFKECVASWKKGLIKNHAEIDKKDISSLSTYYCTCALKLDSTISKKIPLVEQQKQTYRSCMPFAVLENTFHRKAVPAKSQMDSDANALFDTCNLSFPHNRKNPLQHREIANFCQCAAEPLKALKMQKLSEKQVAKRVNQITVKCLMGA